MATKPTNNLAKNDPYQKMDRAETRPETIKQAQQSLSQAETKASIVSQVSKNARPDFSSSFKDNVKGRPSSTIRKNPKGGFIKGKGPITFILFLLFGGGALFFGGQSILGPHIANLYTQATDVQFTSYSLRNQRLFKFMLDGGDQIRITPFSQKFTMFTPYMKSRLAKNNIEVGHLDSNGNFVSGDPLINTSRALQHTTLNPDGTVLSTKTITASSFQTDYATDTAFREAYYKAKRGRVAGFFDDASDAVYRKLGLTRNIFDDFTPTGNSTTDTQNFQETLGSHLGGTDTDINTASRVPDDNGTPDDPSDDTTRTLRNGDDIATGSTAGDTPQAKARTFATGLASKVSSSGGLVCAAMRVANLANIAAFATSTANAINYFMGLTENISKMMAGEGNHSAFNDTMNFFTTSTTTEVPTIDDTGNSTTTTVSGSPLESNGARVVLGGVVPTQYELGAYSLESITSSAKRTVFIQGGSTVTCSTAQAANAVISLIATGIPGGKLAKVVIGMLAETIGGIAITGILATVISSIIPGIARTLFSNVIETYTGIPGGELFSQGAASANGTVAQNASGFTPGSSAVVEANARATSSVIALEAQIDREYRSPFDLSSSNTFLGSLVSSFIPLLTNSSIASPISTISSITSKSLNQLLPSVSATTIAANNPLYTTTYGDCQTLAEIGVKGDIYCNAIFTSDLSTIDIAPDDPTYTQVISRNLNADATEVLDNSELAKFITFCANRESPWGVTDANILNALQTDAGVILNNVPILNDVIDIINATEDTANQDWGTGAICTNTESNERWDSEFKYYQRYIEDMRILGQMGAYHGTSSNPVLGYQEKYYQQHPRDNSKEGYLARITGMTKDDIAFLLEFSEYSNFLANYSPQNLAPIATTEKDSSQSNPVSHLLRHIGSGNNHLVILKVTNQVFLSPAIKLRKNII